jgi:hypothetical protein
LLSRRSGNASHISSCADLLSTVWIEARNQIQELEMFTVLVGSFSIVKGKRSMASALLIRCVTYIWFWHREIENRLWTVSTISS